LRGPLAQQARDHRLFEHLERGGIAEEVGDADQQVAKQRLELLRVVARQAQVVLGLRDLVQRHAPLYAPQQRGFFVL